MHVIEEQLIARLLISVLKGLGGASQEDQQPALVLGMRRLRDSLTGNLTTPEYLSVGVGRLEYSISGSN